MDVFIYRGPLLEAIKEAQVKLESNNDAVWERNKSYYKGLAWAHRLVLDSEVIDAAPVVHGWWIHDINNLYGCSECGERETMPHKKLKNYCHNCGAKMDGRKDNES